MLTFSQMLLKLQEFWAKEGCNIVQPYDIPAGAGTFHPATLLRSLDSTPWSVAYVAPSRRPTDGRYGENPNRLGSYYQFQVLIKPSLENIQDLYHRVGSFIEFLKKEYPNGTVLIVTHSGVCRTLYYYFNGIPENGDMLDGYEAETGRVEIYNV